MAETEVGLVWRLRAQGTRDVQAEIQKITGGLTQARTTAGQAPNVSGWKTAIGGVHTEARSFLGTLGKIAGWGGLAAGAFGMRAVVGDFLSLSDTMRGIQSDTGRSDSEIAKLTERFRNLATEIGKPASEIAAMADLIKDLGTALDRAVEAAPKLEVLAGAFNVKDVQSVATAFAGLEKLSGGKLSVEQQTAMLREILIATPLSKEATLEAVTRSGGRAATIGHMTGEGGIASLGGILATLGKTYSGQEKKIQSGLEAILDGFEAQLTNPEVRRALGRLGINMTDAGTMFDGMLKVLKTTPTALDNIKGLPDGLGTILRGAVRNADVYTQAMGGIVGDTKALRATLTARMTDPSVKLGQSVEKLKAAFEPLIATLLPSLCEAITGLQPLLNLLGKAAAYAADQWEVLVALWLGTKAAQVIDKVAKVATAVAVPVAAGAGGAAAGAGGAAAGIGAPIVAGAFFAASGVAFGTAVQGYLQSQGMKREAESLALASPTGGGGFARPIERWTPEEEAAMARKRGGGSFSDAVQKAVERTMRLAAAQEIARQAINITIQQTTTVSPDGTSGTAHAATDARNGATVQVRDEYSGSYRPPPMQ